MKEREDTYRDKSPRILVCFEEIEAQIGIVWIKSGKTLGVVIEHGRLGLCVMSFADYGGEMVVEGFFRSAE